jgi:hypothetical protein
MEKRSPLGITPEEAAAQTGPKQDAGFAPPKRGTSIPREGGGGRGGEDPATKANRVGRMRDRLGPAFGIRAKMPSMQSPEAGMTQANGRIVSGPSSYGSQSPGFWEEGLTKG